MARISSRHSGGEAVGLRLGAHAEPERQASDQLTPPKMWSVKSRTFSPCLLLLVVFPEK